MDTNTSDTNTSRYWTISIITNPCNQDGRLTKGYRNTQSAVARKFFEDKFPQLSSQETLSYKENKYVQAHLWRMFYDAHDICSQWNLTPLEYRALAGLCLRCYVSHSIITGCQIVANRSSDNPKLVTYHDLLPYVLNDESNTFIVVDWDDNTQFILKKNGETQPMPNPGKFFSVDILQTYNPNLSNCESLDNWCIRRTKQHKDLQTILLSRGVWIPSDWSLLCKNVPQSLDARLKNGDRHFIEVFHGVYRRDRLKSRQTGRCTNPTPKQLQEMLCSLREQDIILHSHEELLLRLQEIADILRDDMYSRKVGTPPAESIDTPSHFADDDNYPSQPHLPPGANLDPEETEWQELQQVVNNLLIEVLSQAIAQRIAEKLAKLAKSRKYACFATKFLEGLQLYYQENNPLSLSEIAALWGVEWSKARRVFDLKGLLETTEYLTEEILIENFTENPIDSRLSSISKSPENLKDIATAIRSYIYEMAFKEAFAEIIAGKHRSRNSLFAQLLRHYLNHNQDTA